MRGIRFILYGCSVIPAASGQCCSKLDPTVSRYGDIGICYRVVYKREADRHRPKDVIIIKIRSRGEYSTSRNGSVGSDHLAEAVVGHLRICNGSETDSENHYRLFQKRKY